MLKLLKRMFGNEPVDNIPFSVIEGWVETKLKDSTLSKDLSGVFDEIHFALTSLSSSLKKIIQLQVDKTLPHDHLDTINENREEYAVKMQNFIKLLKLEKKDAESIIDYSEVLAAALHQIEEGTKEHLLMIEKFVPEATEEIKTTLDGLKDSSQKLNSLIKAELGVKYLHDVQNSIRTARKRSKIALELKSSIEKEALKQKEAEDYKAKLETDVDNLKTMPEYERYDVLVSKRMKIEKELERENDVIRQLFSPISKVLVEYDKRSLGADRALARQYAQDPVSALERDKDFWLMSLLESVSSRLTEIESDEGKRMKIRGAILNISKNVLENHLSRCDALKELMSQSRRQISLDNTTTKIEDIKYKLNHVNQQIKVIAQNKEKQEQALSELDISKDLLMLEKKLSLLGRVKIT